MSSSRSTSRSVPSTLTEQHALADLQIRFDALAVAIALAGTDGEHFALVGFFGGALGNHDARGSFRLLIETLDDDAIMQRT
jgi:hypothetical protein